MRPKREFSSLSLTPKQGAVAEDACWLAADQALATTTFGCQKVPLAKIPPDVPVRTGTSVR
jgi:hypothetical protein